MQIYLEQLQSHTKQVLNWFEGLNSYFFATSLTSDQCVTVTVLNISTWKIVINLGIIFLLSIYTNILCYSLIIYICSMCVVYLMQICIIISYFSSLPHSIICNPLCCEEKCFIFFPLLFGFFCIILLLFLLACYPSLLRALIIFIILRPLFRIKQIGLGTVLRSFFCGLI